LYPVTTPKGFTVNEDPTGAWPSLGIACDGDVRQTIDVIDSRAMELLADNSQALFRMKCTPDTIVKYKFYTPLAYSKPASVLAPLAGGKVVSSTVVEDEHGHHLDHTGITAGSKVKLILSLNSLYFSAKTKCKTYIKVERVQSVEAGTDVAEVATDFACNSNGSDSSSIQARRAVTKSTGHIQNTNNSLTGASASSAGAIYYTITTPPSDPMSMVRPRSHGTMKKAGKSKYAPGVFKAHLRSVALGRTKGKGKGGKKGGKKHHAKRHKHVKGTAKRKGAAYCTRPYRKRDMLMWK
jgi:hypothetical protein